MASRSATSLSSRLSAIEKALSEGGQCSHSDSGDLSAGSLAGLVSEVQGNKTQVTQKTLDDKFLGFLDKISVKTFHELVLATMQFIEVTIEELGELFDTALDGDLKKKICVKLVRAHHLHIGGCSELLLEDGNLFSLIDTFIILNRGDTWVLQQKQVAMFVPDKVGTIRRWGRSSKKHTK